MEKLKSLATLTLYILSFIGCECLLHYIQSLIELGIIASFSLRVMELISATGAIIETLELVFGIEIKNKIKDVFDKN